jgi:hypothetical protein
MITNEQTVVRERAIIQGLKEEYGAAIADYSDYGGPSSEERIKKLIACQQAGTKLFNHIETFVGNSSLLSAHDDGLWATGFAEDCFAWLETIINHFVFLRGAVLDFPEIAESVEPTSTAYANMQRMVVSYLPRDKSVELRKRFALANLPVMGFDMKASESAIPRWVLIAGSVVGILLLVASVAIAMIFPDPTPFQTLVFRSMLSIGLALIASNITGFIKVQLRYDGYFKIISGGALAMFVLTYLVNPPKL